MSGTYAIPTPVRDDAIVHRCASCGAPLMADDTRCYGCGRPLRPVPALLPPAPSTDKRYFSSSASRRRVRSATLLAALLGD